MPRTGKSRWVDDHRRHRSRQDRPVAGDGDQVSAGGVAAAPADNLLLHPLDALLETAQTFHDRPIMRRCTCLDPDQTARQLGKIRQYLPAPQPTGAPAASTACTWNTFLAKSSPTGVTCSMDGSRPLVLLKTNFGTIDAVSGPSTPSSPAMTALSRLDVRPIEKYTSSPS